MDGVGLLAVARRAGLTVVADGDRLRIRGPRRSEPIARRLLEQKSLVLAALPSSPPGPTAGPVPVYDREIAVADLPVDWRLEFEERAAIREFDGGQAREHAEAEALREIVERIKAAGEFRRWSTEST